MSPEILVAINVGVFLGALGISIRTWRMLRAYRRELAEVRKRQEHINAAQEVILASMRRSGVIPFDDPVRHN